jgi:hypothetical protein
VARQRCWRHDWVLDLDIKGFFDNIDWELLMRAVRRHTDCAWVRTQPSFNVEKISRPPDMGDLGFSCAITRKYTYTLVNGVHQVEISNLLILQVNFHVFAWLVKG